MACKAIQSIQMYLFSASINRNFTIEGMGALIGKGNGYSKFMTIAVLLFYTLNIYIVLSIKQSKSVTYSQLLCQKAKEYKVYLSGC